MCENCDAAWKEYVKVRDAARKEYEKRDGPAWKEYKKVRVAARKEYEKVRKKCNDKEG